MEQALVVQDRQILLSPVMNIELAKTRLAEFQAFVKEYLVEGEDFGVIPGTPKPTLLKPGSDKLCELYGLADTYEITNRLEDWDKNLFDYEVRCTLLSKRDGGIVSTGLGSCNSFEGKYRWRQSERLCPKCNQPFIIKGKAEYGGGWLCYAKKGGCGAKFQDGDGAIENQLVRKIENDDLPTLKNTILKMAKKRAKVDATLAATRSSGIFTQDIEDFPDFKTAPSTAQGPDVQRQTNDKQQRTGVLEEIKLAFKSAGLDKEENKGVRFGTLQACFGTKKWTDVQQMDLNTLLDCLTVLKDRLGIKREGTAKPFVAENPDADTIPGTNSQQEAF